MVPRRFLGFKNKNTHHPKYKQGQKFLQGFVFYLRKWTTTALITNAIGRYLKNGFKKNKPRLSKIMTNKLKF